MYAISPLPVPPALFSIQAPPTQERSYNSTGTEERKSLCVLSPFFSSSRSRIGHFFRLPTLSYYWIWYLLPRLLYHTSNFEIQRRSVCRSVVRVDYLVLGQQSIRAVWRGLPERRKATIGGKTFCVTHVKGSAGAQHTHCFVLGWSGLAISCPCCVRRLLPWFLHTSA